MKPKNEVDRMVGARVRQRRVEMRCSQEWLAQQLGLTFQQVQKYEKGTNRIGASRLVQISRALQVMPEFFFQGITGTVVDETAGITTSEFVASAQGQAIIRAWAKMSSKVRTAFVGLASEIGGTSRPKC